MTQCPGSNILRNILLQAHGPMMDHAWVSCWNGDNVCEPALPPLRSVIWDLTSFLSGPRRALGVSAVTQATTVTVGEEQQGQWAKNNIGWLIKCFQSINRIVPPGTVQMDNTLFDLPPSNTMANTVRWANIAMMDFFLSNFSCWIIEFGFCES